MTRSLVTHGRAGDSVGACVKGAERADVVAAVAVLSDELHGLCFRGSKVIETDITYAPR